MRQIIIICGIFFIFPLQQPVEAQTIWKEEFAIPDKGYWVGEDGTLCHDVENIDWSVDVAGADLKASGDYAKTVTTSGGRFEVLDSDGDVVWKSPELNIAGYSTVSVSLKASETGSNVAANKKYLKAFYLLDGQSVPFLPDSIAAGNWGEKILKAEGIRGEQLQLVVTMNSSYSSDKIILDDVLVEGVDSTLFEPQKMVFNKFPSYSFTGDTLVIQASVFDKQEEIIQNKQFGLKFFSDQLSILDSRFVNGIYSWNVIATTKGKASFSIEFEDTTVERLQGSVPVFEKSDLILASDFEQNGFAGWNTDGDWVISSEMPITGDSSIKHLEQVEGGVSSLSTNQVDRLLNDGDYHFSFKLKNGDWDPSSSNSFYFYLCEFDVADSSTNGYAVGVNASGSSDRVSLWRVDDGYPSNLVAETAFDWNENSSAQLDLSRSADGNWLLSVTDLTSENSYSVSGFDDQYRHINQLALHFNYTQSRSGQLWFDDLFVLRENTPPFIQNVVSFSDGSIRVCFSEPIKTENVTINNFTLSGADGHLFNVFSFNVISSDTILLEATGINESNLIVTAKNVEDLEGAVSLKDDFAFEYQFPASACKILINEILFNPKTSGSDFVELYNRSGFSADLSDLHLATRNDTLGLKSICSVSKSEIEFPDQSYIVLTKDSLGLVSFYRVPYPERIVVMSSFPSFPDDAGHVVLLNRSLDVIDEFAYSEEMHSAWISDPEGVSLERNSFDVETSNPENWHSASSLVGYATPGYENSQPETETPDEVSVLIAPDAISPNSDGYHDEMEIKFNLDKSGYLANVYVFDINGRRVRRLMNNDLIGNSSSILFDGTDENQNRLPMGFYILLTELVHPDGDRKVFKNAFLVTDKR